mgnify:CR=1 FL=1
MNNALPDIFLLIIELLRYQCHSPIRLFLSSHPQEREGGKGESGTPKTCFFTDF